MLRIFTKIIKILHNIEFGAVQRNVNLVDLEKCWKMSIWMQKSASVQPRTDKNEIGCGPTTDRGPNVGWDARSPRRRGAACVHFGFSDISGLKWNIEFFDWIFRSFPEFSPKFLKILQIFCNPHWVWIFWSTFAKFRQNFTSISARNSSFPAKIVMFRLNFQYSISQNWWRFLTEFSRSERCKGMLIL